MKKMMFIAGTYKQQYRYKSFLPSQLGKPFEWKSDTVLELLSDANRCIGTPEIVCMHFMNTLKYSDASMGCTHAWYHYIPEINMQK